MSTKSPTMKIEKLFMIDLVHIIAHQNIIWIIYNIHLVEPEGVYLQIPTYLLKTPTHILVDTSYNLR